MRILALTNLYPNPFQPQRAPFNRHLLRLLARRHAVKVIAPIAWTDELGARRAGAAALPAGRAVVCDGLTVEHPRYLFPPRVLRGWYGHFYRASVTRRVRRAVRDFAPDVIFAPWAYPDGWAAVRFGRRYGLPVVVQVHGSDVLLLGRHPARRRPTLEALRRADGVIAVSRDLAGRLTDSGVRPERVRVVYDGVDAARFFPGPRAEARARLGVDPRDPLLLFVGNLVPVKGVDVLLRACAALCTAGQPFRLSLVGQGPLRRGLERQAAELGLADRVTFHGSLPQEQLPDWYRAADAFVLPSHSEGVPNVLLEASACGTPWVASRVGGIPEIVDRGDGRLVPPGDPAALADALQTALRSPARPTPSAPRTRDAAVAEVEAFLEHVRRAEGVTP